MTREKFTVTQFGFVADEAGKLELTEVPVAEKHKAASPYIRLSPSRLKTIAILLDHPEIDPKTFGNNNAAAGARTVAGSIAHLSHQAIEEWDALLPSKTSGYKLVYYRNLENAARLAPTSRPHLITEIFQMLADDRLALPGIRGEINARARQTCAAIITGKCLDLSKQRQPFRDSEPFPIIAEKMSEVPFPAPKLFGEQWEKLNGDRLVTTMAANRFLYAENRTANPDRFTVRQRHPTLSATEVRTFAVCHELGAVWTTHLDRIEREEDAAGKRWTTVLDFKSSPPRFPKKSDVNQRAAPRGSMLMTAQVAASLPRSLEPDGKSISLPNFHLRPIGGNPEIHVIFQAFESPESKPTDYRQLYGPDWEEPGRFYSAMESLGNLIATIISQADRLEPLLSR